MKKNLNSHAYLRGFVQGLASIGFSQNKPKKRKKTLLAITVMTPNTIEQSWKTAAKALTETSNERP